jgi:hypothetical protein
LRRRRERSADAGRAGPETSTERAAISSKVAAGGGYSFRMSLKLVMRTCTSIAALVLAAGLLVIILGGREARARTSCGVWRWDVKTLSDPDKRDVDFHARSVQISKLRHRDPPDSLSTDTPRIGPTEEHVYRVRAQVIRATVEDDSDIHLVIAPRNARRKTMIVEFPHRGCVDSPFKRDQIARARRAMLRVCGSIPSSDFISMSGDVVVSGVGFWDEIHGQTGVAPNGIELHPVLAFRGTCTQD